jgi:pimeloyl-ACP methyl ester carboxylesterase
MYNRAIDRLEPQVRRRASQYRAAVISVHGMNTAGTWQKHLGPVLQDAQIRHEAVDYGNVKLRVLLRRTRDHVADLILAAHERQALYSTNIGIVAHSYGGLSLGHMLQTKPAVRFERIILYGCILAERFPWQTLHRRGQVGIVLNERTRNDLWAKVAPFSGIKEAGWAGICGFQPCDGVVYERDYVWTDHSDLQYRKHYEDRWVPFFLGAIPSASDPPRAPPSPWRQLRWFHQMIFRRAPKSA